jgi:hypothetical protein
MGIAVAGVGLTGAAGAGVALWKTGALSKASPSQLVILAVVVLAIALVAMTTVWIVARCVLGVLDRLAKAAKEPSQSNVLFTLGDGKIAKLDLTTGSASPPGPAPLEPSAPLQAPPLGRPQLVSPPDQTAVERTDGADPDRDPKDPPSPRRRAQ